MELPVRLQVFLVVARRMSFSRAAEELFISQPAVTKHVKDLEDHYNTRLFERNGNRKITLTNAGYLLLSYVEKLRLSYNEMNFEMSHMSDRLSGEIRLEASTSVAYFVLPGLLAKFHQAYPEIKVHLTNESSKDIEKKLLKKEIDFGIIESPSYSPKLKYDNFLDDEIVTVVNRNNPVFAKGAISVKQLADLPVILREKGSGTLEVLTEFLKDYNIDVDKMNVEMKFASSVAIKAYLKKSNCLAFLSVYTVLEELQRGEFSIVKLKEAKIERKFQFVTNEETDSALIDLLKSFLKKSIEFKHTTV